MIQSLLTHRRVAGNIGRRGRSGGGAPLSGLGADGIDLDFMKNRYFGTPLSNVGVVRATPLNGVGHDYAEDSNGIYYPFDPNTRRRTDKGMLIEESRTNSIRNNSMQGAVAGADGVELLTNGDFASRSSGWTTNSGGGGSANITTGIATLVGNGVNFNNYIGQQLTGLVPGRSYIVSLIGSPNTIAILVDTASFGQGNILNLNIVTNGTGNAFPDRGSFVAPANGIVFLSFSRFAASSSTITSVSVQDGERVQNGRFTADVKNALPDTLQNGWQWKLTPANGAASVTYSAGSVVILGDNTNAAQVSAPFPVVNGVTYTITVSCAGQGCAIYVGNSAYSAALLNAVTVVGVGQQFQFTATATGNAWLSFSKASASNVTISNVSVQSAGKQPSLWSGNFNQLGIYQQIVGVGHQNGIDYLDVRVSGTATGAIGVLLYFDAATGDQAAATGVVSAASVFVTKVGGTYTGAGLTLDLAVREDASGVFQRQTLVDLLPYTSVLTRISNIVTSGASTTHVASGIRLSALSGAVIDFTIRIGWPQLELGSWATSPIVTTTAAVTRNADVCTLTTPPTFGSSYSLFAKGTPLAPASYGPTQFWLQADDGTNINRAFIRREGNSGGAARTFQLIGGTGVILAGTTITENVSHKISGAASAGDQATYLDNGGLLTGVAATLPVTPTTVRIGLEATSNSFFNGWIERIAIAPTTRVPNAILQQWTTP